MMHFTIFMLVTDRVIVIRSLFILRVDICILGGTNYSFSITLRLTFSMPDNCSTVQPENYSYNFGGLMVAGAILVEPHTHTHTPSYAAAITHRTCYKLPRFD